MKARNFNKPNNIFTIKKEIPTRTASFSVQFQYKCFTLKN